MVKMAVQAEFYPQNMGFTLCGLQDPAFGMHDDVRFSLQYPQQTQLHLHRSTQCLGVDNYEGVSSPSSCSSFPPIAPFQSLDAQLALQNQEIDRILQIQNEKLRLVLQKQRKRELAVLLSNVGSKTLSLIRRKEEDLALARMRTLELQECLKKAEVEIETWQRLAKTNEAMVIDLNNTLEQVTEKLLLVSHTAKDAASFCGSCGGEDGEQVMKRSSKKMTCKSCYSRSPCVLFLPCRHLCSCQYCEAFLGSCPVCNAVKEDCVEVFLV